MAYSDFRSLCKIRHRRNFLFLELFSFFAAFFQGQSFKEFRVVIEKNRGRPFPPLLVMEKGKPICFCFFPIEKRKLRRRSPFHHPTPKRPPNLPSNFIPQQTRESWKVRALFFWDNLAPSDSHLSCLSPHLQPPLLRWTLLR